MDIVLSLAGLMVGAIAIDAWAVPRVAGVFRPRSAAGLTVLTLVVASGFGALLAVTGNPGGAMVLLMGLLALVTFASNAKERVLGEPLVFSDLALFGAIFRHPQFYVDALSRWQKVAVAGGLLALPLIVLAVSRVDIEARLAGLALAVAGPVLLRAILARPHWSTLTPVPDLARDVARHGLIPILLLYWYNWRQSVDPDPVALLDHDPAEGEVLIVVQCESFADPQELFGERAAALPGLERARGKATLWGNLLVEGFGAYTMRTEFGVLFGRHQDELGFRRFDPYLTARGERTHALSARIAGSPWQRVFVHPHDLRFYGRDTVLSAAGFDRLVGPEAFAQPAGRYVPDADIADAIRREMSDHSGLLMLFAVTIENHGPWQDGANDPVPAAYVDLVGKGDAMLAQLLDMIEGSGRPATLVFYGDHRPSIPGAVEPGPERHTPYVVIRSGHGTMQSDQTPLRADLTPAQLHHAILGLLTAGRADLRGAGRAHAAPAASGGRAA